MQSPPLALVRAAILSPVVAFLGRAGAPVDRYLARAHLPPFVFHTPESLIPLRQVVRFMEDSAREAGIANLGILAARDASIAALGTFGRLVHQEATLGGALQTAMRAMPAFSSGASYRLTLRGAQADVRHEFADAYAAGSRQMHEYWQMLVFSLVRLVRPPRTGEGHEVRFTTADGVPVIVFPALILGRPLAPRFAATPVDEGQVHAWLASAPAADFPGAVQQVIRTLSSPTSPRIGFTAGAIGISVRGLQRRLADAGLSYERLVVQARFEMATQLLESTDSTVLDVALDAGYSDHAHFTRAFRRWTGMSPSEFRRTRRGTERSARDDQRGVGRAAAARTRVDSSDQRASVRTLAKSSFSVSRAGAANPRFTASCNQASAPSGSALTACRQPRS